MSREEYNPPVASLMQNMSSGWLLTATLQPLHGSLQGAHCKQWHFVFSLQHQQPPGTLVAADDHVIVVCFSGCLFNSQSDSVLDRFGAGDLRATWKEGCC